MIFDATYYHRDHSNGSDHNWNQQHYIGLHGVDEQHFTVNYWWQEFHDNYQHHKTHASHDLQVQQDELGQPGVGNTLFDAAYYHRDHFNAFAHA